jgi:hypothetical protein
MRRQFGSWHAFRNVDRYVYKHRTVDQACFLNFQIPQAAGAASCSRSMR